MWPLVHILIYDEWVPYDPVYDLHWAEDGESFTIDSYGYHFVGVRNCEYPDEWSPVEAYGTRSPGRDRELQKKLSTKNELSWEDPK